MKPGPRSIALPSQAEAEMLNHLALEIEHHFSTFKEVFASTYVDGLKTLWWVTCGEGEEAPNSKWSSDWKELATVLVSSVHLTAPPTPKNCSLKHLHRRASASHRCVMWPYIGLQSLLNWKRVSDWYSINWTVPSTNFALEHRKRLLCTPSALFYI